jgi:uncharacterized membrane protein YeaQ/YmgE (transglycosylase-associated protein family)
MNILGWIIFGFVVGLIARAIMPGRDPMGLLGTTILGVAGALLAGWLGQALGWYGPDQGAGFISATVGAIVVLALYHLFVGRRRTGVIGSTVTPMVKSHRDRHDRAA